MQSDADKRFARMQKTTGLHLAMEGEKTLQRITEFPDNPESMDYFYDLSMIFIKMATLCRPTKK
jgi:hypothetical protein